MQREEAVERRVIDCRAAQQPGLDRGSDAGDGAEQAGDDGRAPEGHLTPGQHIAHEGGAHHHQVDQHADDPSHLAGRLVAAVIKAAEDMDIDRKEEQRSAVRMQVAQHIAAIHVAHDMLDRRKGQIDMRRVMHHQHHAGRDLQRQAEGQHDAPDPPPVQVLGGGDHDGVVDQPDDRQAAVQPALGPGLGFVMVVGNSGHLALLSPAGWWCRSRRRRRGYAGSAVPDLCGCGRRCRNASRGRGRTSRRNHRRHRRLARSPDGCRPPA